MTNHDFWMSVSDIIDEGFTSEGLTQLEEYAEQFSTGKILYKRFSSSEQLGCIKGGTIHVIASILAGAEIGSDKLSAPEHSFKREQQLVEIQEKRIETWAKATGCWIDNTNIYKSTLGEQIAKEGRLLSMTTETPSSKPLDWIISFPCKYTHFFESQPIILRKLMK